MKDDAREDHRLSRYAALLAQLESGAGANAAPTLAQEDPLVLARMRTLSTRMLEGLAGARLPALGGERRARALDLVRQVRGAERSARLRSIIARLAGSPGSPAFARRSGGPASFHALYELEGHDLDLYLGEERTLIGQILPRDGRRSSFEAGTAVLQSASGELYTAAIETDGEFSFASVPTGRVRLVLTGTELQVLVEDFDLPAA